MSQSFRSLFLATAACGALLGQQANTTTFGSPLPTGNAEIDKYNGNYIRLTRGLITPKTVADTFGRRIAKQYIAMQITVANRNSQYQWLITNGAIDLARLIVSMETNHKCATQVGSLKNVLNQINYDTAPPDPGGKKDPATDLTRSANPTVTGVDLTVLRGVAEKGQSLDPRNLTFRILQGSGTVAAGLLGITTFGPSFAPAVAAFNGPLLTAYLNAFPDQTVNQLNRLNDKAYAANTLVPKQQAKVLVVFVPMDLLLSASEKKEYFKNPNATFTSPCTDLRLLDASVNGHFVTELVVAPTITSVSIDSTEGMKFGTDNFKVAGVITGQFLDGAKLSLTGVATGLTITNMGSATTESINFQLSSPTPIPSGTSITIVAAKAGLPSASYTIPASYSPARPAVAAGGVQPSSITQGDTKTVEISGAGFLPNAKIRFSDSRGLTIGDVTYVSTTKLKVDIAAATDAPDGPRNFKVETTGDESGNAILTIAKAR